MTRFTVLRVAGVAIALLGVIVALVWNPMTCVTNFSACPTPVPDSSPCPRS